jgi:hypothetical protein
MESGTVYPYRTLKLTWPSLRSGLRSLMPVVMQIHAGASGRASARRGDARCEAIVTLGFVRL